MRIDPFNTTSVSKVSIIPQIAREQVKTVESMLKIVDLSMLTLWGRSPHWLGSKPTLSVSRIVAMNFPSFTTRGHSPITWTFTQLQSTHRTAFPIIHCTNTAVHNYHACTCFPSHNHHHPITHTHTHTI